MRGLQNSVTLQIFILFISLSFMTPAQSPYRLTWGTDPYLLAGGALATGGSFLLLNNIKPLTAEEAMQANRNSVNLYDRQATYHYSESISRASDYTLIAIGTAPLFFLSDKAMRKDWLTIGSMYAETALFTQALINLSKGVFQRSRPFVYNPNAPLDKKLEKDARQSFFSGHTAFSFAAATFFSTVYAKYYPNSTVRPYISGLMIGAATLTGYLRYQAGKHYQSDILTGALVGSAIGYLIPAMHENDDADEELPFSVTPGASLVSISISF